MQEGQRLASGADWHREPLRPCHSGADHAGLSPLRFSAPSMLGELPDHAQSEFNVPALRLHVLNATRDAIIRPASVCPSDLVLPGHRGDASARKTANETFQEVRPGRS